MSSGGVGSDQAPFYSRFRLNYLLLAWAKLRKMSSILIPSRLSKLANTPYLADRWFFIAAAAFSVCNVPEAVPVIYNYAIDNIKDKSPEAKFDVSQKMRESLLKSAALGGLPKAINSLTMLKNVTPLDLRETKLQREQAIPTAEEFKEEFNRGPSFWDQVYGKVAKRVYGQMSTSYPDLAHWALYHVYSPLLSYTKILGPKDTSLVVIACLVPQDVNPQLKGHLRGAMNNGATPEEIASAREMAIAISSWCGITWKEDVAQLKL